MSQWRQEAIERFPELRREIADAEGKYLMWPRLWHDVFKPAYEKDPPDTETLARVYEYAHWCLRHPSQHVRRAVTDEFYERLRDDPRTRREMPRWISQEEFDEMQCAWDYYLTAQELADFRQEFRANRAHIERKNSSG